MSRLFKGAAILFHACAVPGTPIRVEDSRWRPGRPIRAPDTSRFVYIIESVIDNRADDLWASPAGSRREIPVVGDWACLSLAGPWAGVWRVSPKWLRNPLSRPAHGWNNRVPMGPHLFQPWSHFSTQKMEFNYAYRSPLNVCPDPSEDWSPMNNAEICLKFI